MTGPSHRFEDHVGEVALILEAPTPGEIYAEAGRALARLLLNELPPAPPAAPPVRLELQARDPATLLVDWINELIFRIEVERTVFTEFAVELPAPDHLRAELRGLPDPPLAGQVKAATLHQARLEPGPTGYQAHVVLDV